MTENNVQILKFSTNLMKFEYFYVLCKYYVDYKYIFVNFI